MDPVIGTNLSQFNHQQRLSFPGSGERAPEQFDGLIRGVQRDTTFDQADALKKMAASSGRNEVAPVEGFSAGIVEEFSDLALNGLKSKEISYLGV